jgi:hypothetical protein
MGAIRPAQAAVPEVISVDPAAIMSRSRGFLHDHPALSLIVQS